MILEHRTGNVTWLRLNRAAKCNALCLSLKQALIDSCERLKRNREVLVVVLAGEVRHFCAGVYLHSLDGADRAEGVRLNPPADNGKQHLSDIDTNDPTCCEIEGHRLVREYERFCATKSGCADAIVNDVGTQIGIRQTRSITGCQTFKNADVLGARKFGDDAVSGSACRSKITAAAKKIVFLKKIFMKVRRSRWCRRSSIICGVRGAASVRT